MGMTSSKFLPIAELSTKKYFLVLTSDFARTAVGARFVCQSGWIE